MASTEPLLSERLKDCEEGCAKSPLDNALSNEHLRSFLTSKMDPSFLKPLRALIGGETGGQRRATACTLVGREWSTMLILSARALLLGVTLLELPLDVNGHIMMVCALAGLCLSLYITGDLVMKWKRSKMKTSDQVDELFQISRDSKAQLALSMLTWIIAFGLLLFSSLPSWSSAQGCQAQLPLFCKLPNLRSSGCLMWCVQLADTFQNSKVRLNIKAKRRTRKTLHRDVEDARAIQKKFEGQNRKLEGEKRDVQERTCALENELQDLRSRNGNHDEIAAKEAELKELNSKNGALEEASQALEDMRKEVHRVEHDAHTCPDELNASKAVQQTATEAIKEAHRAQKNAEEQMFRLQNKLSTVKKEAESAKIANAKLEEQLELVKNKMREAMKAMDAIKEAHRPLKMAEEERERFRLAAALEERFRTRTVKDVQESWKKTKEELEWVRSRSPSPRPALRGTPYASGAHDPVVKQAGAAKANAAISSKPTGEIYRSGGRQELRVQETPEELREPSGAINRGRSSTVTPMQGLDDQEEALRSSTRTPLEGALQQGTAQDHRSSTGTPMQGLDDQEESSTRTLAENAPQQDPAQAGMSSTGTPMQGLDDQEEALRSSTRTPSEGTLQQGLAQADRSTGTPMQGLDDQEEALRTPAPAKRLSRMEDWLGDL